MSEERESAVADDSIFAPHSVQGITDRLERIANERCDCRTGRHLDALHDLAVDDVPWLIARLREAEAELADRDAEAMNLRAERDELAAKVTAVATALLDAFDKGHSLIPISHVASALEVKP